MKALLALALSGCAISQDKAPSSAAPPIEYQGDRDVPLEFVQDVAASCGAGNFACTVNKARVIMPNPCLFESRDLYAHYLCHELGHMNGWRH